MSKEKTQLIEEARKLAENGFAFSKDDRANCQCNFVCVDGE